jgi:hypothetical protein
MRHIPFLLLFGCAAAWAQPAPQPQQGPLVGPGVVGQQDKDGHVKGADAGAGPHEHFDYQQFERRVDPAREQIAAEQKEKAQKAEQDRKAEQKAGAGATR